MNKEKGRVPKLRFPGFTEDWEQRKVNEIFKVTRGQVLAASFTTPEKNRGNIYPVYSSQTKDNGLLGYYSEYLFENAITWTTDGANAGTVNFRPGRFYSTNVNGVLINENGYACYAVSEIINKVAYKYVSKVGNPKLMNNVMAEINIMITPDIDELKQISKLIEAYNQYITLHQRKLEHLNLKKKALLQKLFPKNGERYPELRFLGFTNAWEQRKLGDYLIQYTEITTQNNQYPVLTSSRKGLFFQTDYYDGNQIASKDNTGYNIVPYGYFTYRHMSDDEIFHFNINYIVDKGIVSTLYPVFTTKNLNSDFLQLQLNYGNEFRKYAVLLKQGGSRTYMYFNKLKSLNLTISTSIGEQEIIAKFFILFEKLITLHQRKLEHLQLQKKALLQQMFV